MFSFPYAGPYGPDAGTGFPRDFRAESPFRMPDGLPAQNMRGPAFYVNIFTFFVHNAIA